MNEIEYSNKIFKRYKDTKYYISEDGQVYSLYSNKILKPYIDKDGYHRIDCYQNGKQHHIKIHKMVYECWVGEVSIGKQINHHDDDKNNNHYLNLYSGTQKENIRDCIKNNHRVGASNMLIIKDKNTSEEMRFQPAKNFIDYSNHSQRNGSIKRVLNRKWFKDNYELIYYGKGVTTRERVESTNEYRTAEISTAGSALACNTSKR